MITLETLLDELIDRKQIVQFQNPIYTHKTASSHDPRSKDPDDVVEWTGDRPKAKELGGWFANIDYSQFIRKEERDGQSEYVMLECEKPGHLVWFWNAPPHRDNKIQHGKIRIYFNGNETPDIEMVLEDFMNGGLCETPLSIVLSRGRNLFLPLTWSQSCKITFENNRWETNEPKDSLWYIFNYREYPDNTKIEQFSLDLLGKYENKIQEINSALLDGSMRLGSNYLNGLQTIEKKDITLNSEELSTIMELSGTQIIQSLQITLDTSIDESEFKEQLARKIVISIEFDGIQTVCCPLGDLFCSGISLIPIKSWYATITADLSLISHWFMPFKEKCTISLTNYCEFPIQIKAIIANSTPYKWTNNTMYFHSNWKQNQDYPTRPISDWNYIDIKGKGIYVGDTLTIYNSWETWWGEGDAKVWLDGELQFHSTGTEDYYGYAWGGHGQFFESPWMSHTRWWGNKKVGYASVSRNRLLDTLCFKESLKLDMEIWHWKKTLIDVAVSCKFYLIKAQSVTIDVDEIKANIKKDVHTPPKKSLLSKLKDLFKK